ncbi:MAG: hypothetical protein AB1403_12940 [Candidatus Riflebacteria bacterium]
MNESRLSENASESRRSESGFSIQALLIALLLIYILFPVAIVYPVQKTFGTVPKFLELVFIPMEWLYNRSKLYRDYIDLQAQILRP